MTRYIDTREQAAMVRKALKKNFPTVKFSVRIQRYAGGSSVHVRYVDGPPEKSVSAVVDRFDGKRFDGMIDLSYNANHYLLPDGSVEFAYTTGHSFEQEPPRPKPEGAEVVHFSGSASVNRKLSPEFETSLARELAATTDDDPDHFFTEYNTEGTRWLRGDILVKAFVDDDGKAWPLSNGEDYASHLVWKMASLRNGPNL